MHLFDARFLFAYAGSAEVTIKTVVNYDVVYLVMLNTIHCGFGTFVDVICFDQF